MGKAQLEQLRPILAQYKSKMVGDIPQIRNAFDEMLMQAPIPPGVAFEQQSVSGIPASWCIPSQAVDGRVLLYLHGGGYVIGSAKAYRPMGSEFAVRLKSCVLIPDYRLAPENPFPAALEDAVCVYRWLIDQGTNPKSIVVAGDSCGGGLTVATLAAVRDLGLPLPAGAAVISPWVDLDVRSDSLTSKARQDPLIEADGLREMAGAYLGATPPRTPGASPLYANLKGLPPLLIQVGSAEVLLDDATRLAARAGAAGVRIRLDVWPDMFHVWHTSAALLDEARDALDDAAAFLGQQLSRTT
ncbi:MAG TPA: alpha/beta hydrolase [Terriglobia bacterium]